MVAGALLLACAAAGAITVEEIPSPRPQGWVSDVAGILDDGVEQRVDAIAEAVHARDGAELAVVTIRSTGGAEPRDFATRLFNHWGIGDADRDNGVLILVAIEDRAAELILGDGVDDDARVAIANDIMQRQMVPRFRDGDPGAAVVVGAQEVAARILGGEPAARGTLAPTTPSVVAPAAPAVDTEASAASPSARSRSALDDPDVRALGLGLGGTGALGALVLGLRRYARYRPRRCDRCGAGMTLLDEGGDDAHLRPAELKEESLESVDYDVWACNGCRHAEKLRYGAWFTRYAKCPQCNAVTKASAETTLVAATYEHGGRVRVDEHCEFCAYRHSFERSTPKKTRSSSSSGSGFGGGSSSGRGSSGRW